MMFDTDVLIWALRGKRSAASLVNAHQPRLVSAITYMELVRGARNKQEALGIRDLLNSLGFRILPLDPKITERAITYMEEHALASSLGIADALIAATAVQSDESLCTANVKHFRVINGLPLLPYRP